MNIQKKQKSRIVGIEDIINGSELIKWNSNSRDGFISESYGEALRRAEDEIKSGGVLVSMPYLIAGRSTNKKFLGAPFNRDLAVLSGEVSGVDSHGRLVHPGEEIIVVVHGDSFLSPEAIINAKQDNSLKSDWQASDASFDISESMFNNLLGGRLPSGKSIELYSVEDLNRGKTPDPFDKFAIWLPMKDAKGLEFYQKTSTLLNNPLVQARAGTMDYLETYLDKLAYSIGEDIMHINPYFGFPYKGRPLGLRPLTLDFGREFVTLGFDFHGQNVPFHAGLLIVKPKKKNNRGRSLFNDKIKYLTSLKEDSPKSSLEKKLFGYVQVGILSEDTDIKEVAKSIPTIKDYIDEVKMESASNHGKIESIAVNPKQDIIAFLTDSWYWNGNGNSDTEYSKNIFIFRGEYKDKKSIKYRDNHGNTLNENLLRAGTIGELKLQDSGKRLDVLVTSNKSKDNSRNSIFSFQLPDYKPNLTKKKILPIGEQNNFADYYQQQKKHLLENNTRTGALMPGYIKGGSRNLIHYEPANVLNEYLDIAHGVGVLKIKSQIDFSIEDGLQYKTISYKITPDNTITIDTETSWSGQFTK